MVGREESAEAVIHLSIRFLKKLCEFHRKVPVLEPPFNGVSGLETCNFNHWLLPFVNPPAFFSA